MFARIRRFFAAPTFEDEEKTRIANLLNTLVWVLVPLLLVSGLYYVWNYGGMAYLPPLLALTGSIGLSALLTLLLIHRGRVRAASLLFSAMFWLGAMLVVVGSGGVRSPDYSVILLSIIVIGLLLGGHAATIVTGLTLLAGVGLIVAEANGLLPAFDLDDIAPWSAWLDRSIDLVLAVVLLYLVNRSIRSSLRHAQRIEQTLIQANLELEASRDVLQIQTRDLERRAGYLEATATIAQNATAILDLQELLDRVVILIGERFGLYHVGIFLLDPSGEWAVLQAASSEGGQRMLARHHRLKVGEMGIVGFVTGQGQARIALDVGQDAVYLDNPDLPDTRSEMALPLQARGEVIGALDVQSVEAEAFTDEDIAVLQILANQIAIAISNARFLRQAQESLEAERRAYGELGREAWQSMIHDQPDLGFLSNREDTVPVGDLWRPEMKVALRTGQTTLGDGDMTTLAIPIKVRDQIIGVVDGRKADGSGEWMPGEIELLEALTGQLNVALEGARLYRDAQRLAARERVIGQVTGHMREPLELEAVLETAVSEIRQALGLDELVVRLTAPRPMQEEEPDLPLSLWPKISEGDSV
jgi:GAF domain-containing protein